MPNILVTGATGQQGGGVIDALLSSGRHDVSVIALTRNPSSNSAATLTKRGVQLRKGDLLDRESLSTALQGIDVAYLVTDFRGQEDVKGEVTQGMSFVEASRQAGIKHVVFSSVAGADISQPVDHFQTKLTIEECIEDSGLSWTFIRPVGFMEVIPGPGIGRDLFLSAMAALMGKTKQKYVACEDIGKAVALALLDPDRFRGRTLTLVGQTADVDELQAALEEAEGNKGWGRLWLPRWLIIRLTPHHYRQMFDWLYYDNCQPGDPEETRKILPDLLNLKDWARKQQDKQKLL